MKITKKNLAIAIIASSVSLLALIPILIGTKNKNKNIFYVLAALASVQTVVGSFMLCGMDKTSALSTDENKKKRSFYRFDKDEYEIFTYDEADNAEKIIFAELNNGHNNTNNTKLNLSNNNFISTNKT